jgi:hypothetical protein
MTTPAILESFSTLHFSPYVVAPLIEVLYQDLPPSPKNLLLSYLIYPLVLNPSSREFLRHANKTSSLRTLAKIGERLHGIADSVRQYRQLTNLSVQLAVDVGSLRIDQEAAIHFLESKLDCSVTSTELLRASKNLGKVLSSHDTVAAYRFLGIKEL